MFFPLCRLDSFDDEVKTATKTTRSSAKVALNGTTHRLSQPHTPPSDFDNHTLKKVLFLHQFELIAFSFSPLDERSNKHSQ